MTDDTTRRDALARLVASRIPMLTLDELRVVDVILGRICGQGRETYGPLDLSRETRDFRNEAADEYADALWYMACDVVARNNERRERLECAARDEIERGLGDLMDATTDVVDRRFDSSEELGG